MSADGSPRSLRVGYYIHHHGAGHVTRALGVAARIPGAVTGLSSLARPDGWVGDWVRLPRDDDQDPGARGDGWWVEPEAGGALHWAPLEHNGFRERMGMIAEWVRDSGCDVMVVDVSAEVTLLARLLGVPVVLFAMPGDRSDAAHVAAYDAASAVVAPWPAVAANRAWPGRWLAKTVHAGAISRFDGTASVSVAVPNRVSVLWGYGGGDWSAEQRRLAAEATPGWQWRVAGQDEPVGESLQHADVVVCHAGQNSVAEVAALRRPAVVVALDRPHGEQAATAAALTRTGIAVATVGLPEPAEWAGLLEAARLKGGDRWAEWSDGRGALRAGLVVGAVARGQRVAGGTAVVTLAGGRPAHLRAMLRALGRGATLPERVVVVALDTQVGGIVQECARETGLDLEVVAHPVGEGEPLPLAAARNAGAAAAVRAGARRLVFLDVDCLAGEGLVRTYHDAMVGADAGGAAADPDGGVPTVWAGAVTYLPEREPGRDYDLADLPRLRSPHPVRPDPAPGTVVPAEDTRLFWSLSFGVSVADFERIGGFCEEYVGYGGEDTDFAMALDAAGGQLVWIGGADAYHQHHPTSDPPVQHLHDILRNGALFAERWGWYPMEGWLEGFAKLGLAQRDSRTGRWVATESGVS